MHFTEIETKYKATDISLDDFKKGCESIGSAKLVKVESYDHYYTKSADKFIRYRTGDSPQLTIKEKTADGNNFRRREVNLDLASVLESDQKLVVDEFCSMLGFDPNFTIYKESVIYYYPKFNTVYYVVFEDESKQKEIGRFIEIEMSETHEWESEEEAWNLLLSVEKDLAGIGITPQRRVKKSLFETYRK